ncbi:MAG: [FeFe] hydrogenase H-cluster radical SAM maturase HydG, partial [Candidatus Omnitrophica bacterium]|nr:[FeFe] hydrogenase H-cluster radical SAM maturase HydG [Candidatus Omnitrophota bacterium]
MNFIDEDKINNILKNTPKPTKTALARILTKAGKLKGLDIGEIASLIKVSDRQDLARIYKAAAFVKEKIYGSRVVLFAPLYLTNECINNCLYCGFRLDNKKLERRSLKISEAVQQARILEAQGHKRILLVCGETKKQASAKKIAQYVKAIYEQTGIRI